MQDTSAQSRVRVSKLRSILGCVFLVFWCLFGALVMLVAKGLNLRAADTFPLFFHGVMCRLFSIRCEVQGAIHTDSRTMYVSNHVSYLDVFVLGSLVEGAFVAKSEVAGWPVFGKLAKLQNTLFLERRSARAADQIKQLRKHLDSDGNLIVFPEGTSTAGTDVARFRSSLFAAATDVIIQPISVAYVEYEEQPMTQSERDHYAWYLPDPSQPVPNEPFVSHFFNGMGLGRATVKVIFHEPVGVPASDRKACALASERAVRQGLEEALEIPSQMATVG